tara:strand:- start:1357 stop:2130 length:774 start_codon:yes stop_codon:yes gene_type:complete
MELTANNLINVNECKNQLPLNPENCPDFSNYQEIGRMVQASVFNHQWWVGDWIIYGEDYFPDKYSQAIEVTGMAAQTLMNYRWVASKFPPERRVPELSFTAHKQLASLTEEEQDAIIKLALDNGITDSRGILKLTKQLKEQMKIAAADSDNHSNPAEDNPDSYHLGGDDGGAYEAANDFYDLAEEDEEEETKKEPRGSLLNESEKVWINRLISGGNGTLEKARVGVGALVDHINPEDIAALDRVIAQLKELRAWYCG